jgi:hypothetical protein
LLAVPLAVMALEQVSAPDPDPIAAATGYFHARGEQLVAMSDDPAAARQYLRNVDPDRAHVSGWDAARSLIAQNASDLARLLLDRDTAPVPTDYWNARGRLWPWFLVPFAVLGGGLALWSVLRRDRVSLLPLLPLLLCCGLALPLLLTSRVHIGRLLPALPFALLLVAAGAWHSSTWLEQLVRRVGAAKAASGIAPGLALALLLPLAVSARIDMLTPLAPSHEALTAATMANWQADAQERGGAVFVEDPGLGDDIERVHAATYRLDLDPLYRFVDLKTQTSSQPRPADPRPPLLWRGALPALQAGEIAQPCARLWFVAPEIAHEFFAAWRTSGCPGVPDSVILP